MPDDTEERILAFLDCDDLTETVELSSKTEVGYSATLRALHRLRRRGLVVAIPSPWNHRAVAWKKTVVPESAKNESYDRFADVLHLYGDGYRGPVHGDWIPGLEGVVILLRDMETDDVVGMSILNAKHLIATLENES